MVPAGPAGSTGTVSAARDMMVLRKLSAKMREPAPATRARTPWRRSQRLLRICSTCTSGSSSGVPSSSRAWVQMSLTSSDSRSSLLLKRP